VYYNFIIDSALVIRAALLFALPRCGADHITKESTLRNYACVYVGFAFSIPYSLHEILGAAGKANKVFEKIPD
jgi:hypothetical protein